MLRVHWHLHDHPPHRCLNMFEFTYVNHKNMDFNRFLPRNEPEIHLYQCATKSHGKGIQGSTNTTPLTGTLAVTKSSIVKSIFVCLGGRPGAISLLAGLGLGGTSYSTIDREEEGSFSTLAIPIP